MAETLGTYLREQRLERGLSLEAIAGETRVPLQYLQGLEEDDLSKLPGAIVLAKAYLRSYVRCLRLSAAVEDHAMAYLADAMVAARDDRQTTAPESRRSFLTTLLDLYYGILVTWTLARQRAFQALLQQWSACGQRLRAAVTMTALWSVKLSRAGALRLITLLRQLLSYGAVACQTGSGAFQTQMKRYADAAIPPAVSASKAALGVALSRSQTFTHRLTSLSKAARELTAGLLQDGVERVVSLITGIVRHIRMTLARIGRRLTDTAQASTSDCLSSGQKALRVLGSGLGRVSSVLSSSIASVLYFASLLTSISILSLITLARAISRASSRGLESVGELYEAMRQSMDLSQPAPVRMDEWCEVGAGSSVSKSHESVRATYLTSALMPPESQRRIAEQSDRPTGLDQLSFRDRHRHHRGKIGAWDMRAWHWVANYVVALILAFVLAGILGDAPLFRSTMLGETTLNASRLVQFIGYGTALLLFWLLGLRVAAQIPDTPMLSAFIRRLMTPLVTLVTFSGLYKILLLLGDPFLSKSGRQLYDWTFVILIMASAAWVTMAGFWMVHNAKDESANPADGPLEVADRPNCFCPRCQTPVDSGMRFCGYCGSTIS